MFVLCVFLLCVTPFACAYNERLTKHVLVLNSYHKGLSWSDSIMEGISQTLRNNKAYYFDLYIEYMDTKRISDPQHYENLLRLYAHKFKNRTFDMIISCDDNAFRFVLKYRRQLFPGTPVVFCGVNDFDAALIEGHENITGLIETFDIRKTINLMIELHPQLTEIIVISDRTTTGRAITKQVKSFIPEYGNRLSFTFFEDMTMEQMRHEVSILPDSRAILLMSFLKDAAGNTFEYRDSSRLIAQKASVPIYGFWDFYVGYGIVGGYVKSGLLQGKQAAAIALSLIESPDESMPLIREENFNEYMFDYNKLKLWNIPLKELPAGSIIKNKPYSFYHANKKKFWAVVGFIVLQTVIIIILISNVLLRKKAQKEIVKFKTLTDTANYGVVIISIDGTIIYVNPYFAQIHGYDVPEMTGRHFTRFHPDNDHESLKQLLRQTIVTGHLDSKEVVHINKDGAVFPMLMAGVLVRDKHNKGLFLAFSALDLTEQKKAQERIRLLSSAIEQSKEGISVTDMDGNYLFFNDAYKQMHAISGSGLQFKNISVTYLEEERQTVNDMLRETRENGVFRGEMLKKRPDGSVFPIHISCSLMHNSNGEPVGYISSIRDITDLKKKEDTLRTQAQIIAQIHDAIITTDLTGTITTFNRGAEAMSGYTADEVIGKKVSSLYPPEQRPWLNNKLIPSVIKEDHAEFETAIHTKNGAVFYGQTSLSLMKNHDGRPVGIIGYTRDISERKKAEQEKERLLETLAQNNKKLEKQNSELEQFAYTVSHDLKTPLITIKCFLDIMQRTDTIKDPAVHEYINKIHNAADRMKQLLDELLQISRIGIVTTEKEPIDFKELIDETLDIVAGQLENSGISIKTDIKQPVIFGDRRRMQEVMQNLLENSVKFMRKCSNPLIEIGSYKKSDNETICYVRDTGIGIQDKYIEKIFSLFDKLDPHSEGTGVGLTLVRRIIETHGGRVWAESPGENQGATFYFSLPMQQPSTIKGDTDE